MLHCPLSDLLLGYLLTYFHSQPETRLLVRWVVNTRVVHAHSLQLHCASLN